MNPSSFRPYQIVQSAYQPTDGDIVALEKSLGRYLKEHHPDLYLKYPAYRRQYWGEIKAGTKIIFGNFGDDKDFYTSDGTKSEVDDGGDQYFQCTYDLSNDEITTFDVNGES